MDTLPSILGQPVPAVGKPRLTSQTGRGQVLLQGEGSRGRGVPVLALTPTRRGAWASFLWACNELNNPGYSCQHRELEEDSSCLRAAGSQSVTQASSWLWSLPLMELANLTCVHPAHRAWTCKAGC